MTMISSDAAVKTEDLYLSDTIRYLVSIKDDVHDRSQIPHRDQVYRRVFAENPDDLQALKFAKAFAAFLAEKKIFIHPRDILAGFTYRYTYGTTIPVDMPDDYDPLYRPPVMPDSQREYETVLLHHGLSPDSKEAKELRIFLSGVDAWLYKHWFSGHILPGYDRLVKIGFTGLEAGGGIRGSAHRCEPGVRRSHAHYQPRRRGLYGPVCGAGGKHGGGSRGSPVPPKPLPHRGKLPPSDGGRPQKLLRRGAAAVAGPGDDDGGEYPRLGISGPDGRVSGAVL